MASRLFGPQFFGTHPRQNGVRSDRLRSLTASEKKSPATAAHDPARNPAEDEKLATSTRALMLVTYKELLLRPGPPWRGA